MGYFMPYVPWTNPSGRRSSSHRRSFSRLLGGSITNRVKLRDELPPPRSAVAGEFHQIMCRVVSQNIWIASTAVEVGQQLLADVPSADVDACHGVEYAVEAVLTPFDSLYSPTIKRARSLVWKWHIQPLVRMTRSHYVKAIIQIDTRPNSPATFIVQPRIDARAGLQSEIRKVPGT